MGKGVLSPEGFKQEDYEERIVCFVCASGDAGRHGAGALVVEVGVGESDREDFLATLKNESDTTEYIVSRSPSNHSILCAIYETVDETVDDTCQFRRECFFDFKVQSVYFIKPHEEFKVKLHLCISPVEFINGVLPYNSALTRKIRRVRIMIDDLYFLPYPPIYDLKEMMHADVYSNWLEIDGEEFYRIFRGNVMSSD